jgi:hypothetical protein
MKLNEMIRPARRVFMAKVKAVIAGCENKAAGITGSNTIRKDEPTRDIDYANLFCISTPVLYLVGKQGRVFRDAMDCYRSERSKPGRINQQPFQPGGALLDIDAGLLLVPVPAPVEVVASNFSRLIYGFYIQRISDTPSQHIKRIARREIRLAPFLLNFNPLVRLRQATIFQPAIWITDMNAMNHFFNRVK